MFKKVLSGLVSFTAVTAAFFIAVVLAIAGPPTPSEAGVSFTAFHELACAQFRDAPTCPQRETRVTSPPAPEPDIAPPPRPAPPIVIAEAPPAPVASSGPQPELLGAEAPPRRQARVRPPAREVAAEERRPARARTTQRAPRAAIERRAEAPRPRVRTANERRTTTAQRQNPTRQRGATARAPERPRVVTQASRASTLPAPPRASPPQAVDPNWAQQVMEADASAEEYQRAEEEYQRAEWRERRRERRRRWREYWYGEAGPPRDEYPEPDRWGGPAEDRAWPEDARGWEGREDPKDDKDEWSYRGDPD